jgi:hypothetical protein
MVLQSHHGGPQEAKACPARVVYCQLCCLVPVGWRKDKGACYVLLVAALLLDLTRFFWQNLSGFSVAACTTYTRQQALKDKTQHRQLCCDNAPLLANSRQDKKAA